MQGQGQGLDIRGQGQGQGLGIRGQGQGLDILGQEHDSWGLCRVGHWSIFADPIQSNPKI